MKLIESQIHQSILCKLQFSKQLDSENSVNKYELSFLQSSMSIVGSGFQTNRQLETF